MAKSPDAFRTISEVADWLGIQAHVLRFWESKFTQVKPIKRAGGRRYYRPGDMLLLGGIKKLLHDDGLTIKGVQKILREEGMNHVSDMSAPLDELTLSQLGDEEKTVIDTKPATAIVMPEEEKGVVLNFDAGSAAKAEPFAAEKDVSEQDVTDDIAAEAVPEPESTPQPASKPEPAAGEPDTAVEPAPGDAEEAVPEKAARPAPVAELPAFLRRPLADQNTNAKTPDADAQTERQDANAPDKQEPVADLDAPEPDAAAPDAPAPRKPRLIDLPALTAEADFPATPATLTAAFRARKIAPANLRETADLLHRLTALRDQMSARRRPTPPAPSKG